MMQGKKSGKVTGAASGALPLLLACLMLWVLLPAAAAAEVDQHTEPATAKAIGQPPGLLAAKAPADDEYDPWDDDPLVDDLWDDDPWDNPWDAKSLADPLEPLNRVFFKFNDRLYVWALDPVARGYANVMPEDIRLCVRRFFRNLLAPVRVVNHLLQGRVKDSGTELARFAINTTVGIGGLVDSAADNFGLQQRHADLGQTLGVYGFGEGFYIHWPILGPSSLRDTVGRFGDSFVNPISRVMADDFQAGAALYGARTVNTVSLHPGEYERLVGSAFDPYIAVRDAYWQYRRGQIQLRDKKGGEVPGVFSRDAGIRPGRAVAYTEDAGAESGVEDAAANIASAADTAEQLPELADCGGQGYFVHVGAYIDRRQLGDGLNQLGDQAEKACQVVHYRHDYHFYGLMVPAGADFPAAKELEQQLAAAGASGWLVAAFD